MIVDPDFFDHWRTQMVADMLGGDPIAPLYVMRLWAHCQNRKADSFDIPTLGIKALCKFQGDAQALEDALIAAEYLIRDGLRVTVIGWAEKNASLLAAWENGGKGGRPRKTHQEPTGNQQETHGLPSGNPSLTHAKPIREDKSREEEIQEQPVRAKRSPAPDCPEDVDAQVWADWLALRKAKKAPVTPTVIAEARREAIKAALTLTQFLSVWCGRGSQGLQADWLKPEERGRAPPGMTPREQRQAENVRAWMGSAYQPNNEDGYAPPIAIR